MEAEKVPQRDARRYKAIAEEILTRPGPERNADGDRRVQGYLKNILAIKDVSVRETVKEIIRNGNLNANLLKRLTSFSGNITGSEKSLVTSLEKNGITEAMEKIERVLRMDKKILLQHETRRKASRMLSTSKPAPVADLNSYEGTSKKLYDLLLKNFFYLEDPLAPLRNANPIIAELKKLEVEAELIERGVHQSEYLGRDFGARTTTSPSEAIPQPVPERAETTEEREKSTKDFQRRTDRSKKFY